MLDGSAQSDSLDTMKSAFSAAGKLTHEEEAKKAVQRFWDETHNIDQTRIRFGRWFEERNPHAKAVFGKVWQDYIFAFTGKACPIETLTRKVGGKRGNAARYKNHVYSTDPDAIWARKKRAKMRGETVLEEPTTQSPRSARNAEAYRRYAERTRRGVVQAKVEIDKRTGEITALLTKLPASLQSFATWTAERALTWCERQEQHAGMVRIWCQMTADPRKTLGEQLTPEIVAALTA